MQRIVKRFLLHKQRESDEVGEADFDELKQDLQMVRYEMLNDLKKSRDDTLKFISHINNGILLIGDELFKESLSQNAQSFRDYKNSEYEFGDDFNDDSKESSKTSTTIVRDLDQINELSNVKLSIDKNKSSDDKKIGTPNSSSLGSSVDNNSLSDQLLDSSQLENNSSMQALSTLSIPMDKQKQSEINELHAISEE